MRTIVEMLRVHLAHSEQTLKDVGPCEHDIGICACDLISDIEEAQGALAVLPQPATYLSQRDELAEALRYYSAIKGPIGEPARVALAKL